MIVSPIISDLNSLNLGSVDISVELRKNSDNFLSAKKTLRRMCLSYLAVRVRKIAFRQS